MPRIRTGQWRYSTTQQLTFFQLGSEWVSLTAQALYSQKKIPGTFWIGRCLGFRAGLGHCGEEKRLVSDLKLSKAVAFRT